MLPKIFTTLFPGEPFFGNVDHFLKVPKRSIKRIPYGNWKILINSKTLYNGEMQGNVPILGSVAAPPVTEKVNSSKEEADLKENSFQNLLKIKMFYFDET